MMPNGTRKHKIKAEKERGNTMAKNAKCLKCGAVITDTTAATAIKTTCGIQYYCAACADRIFEMRRYGYSTENAIRKSKPTADNFTISKEFEIPVAITRVLPLPEIKKLLCTMDHLGWLPTSDCTVYVECKSPIYNGLQSYNKVSKTISELAKVTSWANDNSYGTHTNIGHTDFDDAKMDILRRWRETLLTPLQDYMIQHEYKTVAIFSRPVADWCGRLGSDWTNHSAFINLQHSTWVEFRINKYTSYEQDSYATKVCIALFAEMLKFAKAIQANRATYTGAKLAEVNRATAIKYAAKLVKVFEKMYADKYETTAASVRA